MMKEGRLGAAMDDPSRGGPDRRSWTRLRRSVCGRYAALSPRVRWHVWGRLRLCPLRSLLPYLPASGKMTELGCGQGCFSHLARLYRPDLEVRGIDPCVEAISTARRASDGLSDIHFEVGDAGLLEASSPDCICVVDVFYLLPFERWDSLLRLCYRRLRPGGVLLLKDMDVRPAWKHAVNYLQEALAVRLIGWTRGSGLYFEPREKFSARLERAGFSVSCVDLAAGYPYPHLLYLCRR